MVSVREGYVCASNAQLEVNTPQSFVNALLLNQKFRNFLVTETNLSCLSARAFRYSRGLPSIRSMRTSGMLFCTSHEPYLDRHDKPHQYKT